MEVYSEPSQICSIFEKVSKNFQLLTIFTKCSTLDVWRDSEYLSGYTGLSVVESWVNVLLAAWSAYPHKDGIIIFVV